MLELLHASVVDQATDAIVNAANRALAGGGGVDGAIHAAAGPELDRACRQIGFCPTGSAVITPSFNLATRGGCRFIIHTVGPIYFRETPEHASELLASCYRSSCKLAQSRDLRSISFCSISTGVYGYPMEEALPIALKELLAASPAFEKIEFCLFTDEEYARGRKIAEVAAITHEEGSALAIDRMR